MLCAVTHTVIGEEAKPKTTPYLASARRFADTVLERGRDVYGEQKTPLFVDGLHAETLEPAKWKDNRTYDWLVFYGEE